jgi:hypothetical protein
MNRAVELVEDEVDDASSVGRPTMRWFKNDSVDGRAVGTNECTTPTGKVDKLASSSNDSTAACATAPEEDRLVNVESKRGDNMTLFFFVLFDPTEHGRR